MKEALDAAGIDYRMLVLPDHPTPIRVRTHTSDAVPYLLYDSTGLQEHTWSYNEKEAATSGNAIARGCELMPHFFA